MAQQAPTKPYLKDLPVEAQFQFNLLKKYDSKLRYTAIKETVATLGPMNEKTISEFINHQFCELLKSKVEAVRDARIIRDYLISISGGQNE